MLRTARIALAIACCSCLVGCFPIARLGLKVVVAGHGAIDPHRVQVTAAKSCPPGAVRVPAPATGHGDVEHVLIKAAGARALEITAAFRGRSCSVRLAAWFDHDGSGTLNSGDYSGVTPAVLVRDRGVLLGNLTRGPTLTLARVP